MEEKSSEICLKIPSTKISLTKQNAMAEDQKLCFTRATNFTREF